MVSVTGLARIAVEGVTADMFAAEWVEDIFASIDGDEVGRVVSDTKTGKAADVTAYARHKFERG